MSTKNAAVKPPSPLFGPIDEPDQPFTRQLHQADFDADINTSSAFLLSYKGSQATFNAYRREIERLLQWLFFIQKTHIKTLDRQHIEDFIQQILY